MAPYKVHMVRFYEPDPQMEAIHSMSLRYVFDNMDNNPHMKVTGSTYVCV